MDCIWYGMHMGCICGGEVPLLRITIIFVVS